MRKTLMLTACLTALAGPAIAASPGAYTSENAAPLASIPYNPAATYIRQGGPAATATAPAVTPPPSTAAVPQTELQTGTPQTDTMNPQMNPHDVRGPHR